MRHVVPTIHALTALVYLAGCGSSGSDNGPTDASTDVEQTTALVEDALASGSAESITDPKLLTDAILALLDDDQNQRNAIATTLSNGVDTLSWDPSHDACLFGATPGETYAVLHANASNRDDGEFTPDPLAVAGQRGSAKYLALAGNPFRNADSDPAVVDDGMWKFIENSLTWLTGQPVDAIEHVVIAHLDDSHYFRDYPSTAAYLKTNASPNLVMNEHTACDGDKIAGCLAGDTPPDLLIVSQWDENTADTTAVPAAVRDSLARGIPVLYMHWDGGLTDLGRYLLETLRIQYDGDNYWTKRKIVAVPGADLLDKVDADMAAIRMLIAGLASGEWPFAFGDCATTETCEDVIATFIDAAEVVQDRLRQYDADGVYLFEKEGYLLDKLLVLLADVYRKSVTYPMDTTTELNTFLKAYFADHAQYQRRTSALVPPDLGNFSRTTFEGVTVGTETRSYTSREPFRAAGFYALPGQMITVTRLDDSPVETKVFVNTIRDAATHEFDQEGYSRPKFVRGEEMPVEKGKPLRFTSTYGGPIQIDYDVNDHDVMLQFEGVAQHPYWRSAADDDSFTQALSDGKFDWAELATPGFEVHSKLELMRESSQNPNWPTPSRLAQATMTYTYNYPHVLAGFKGDGIDVVDEIHDFANARGWTIHPLEVVKHMNADQAACGYGCSGNPYDAYWDFDPIGHGDIHELGHGLERSRFRFDGWEGHSTTNLYSYYSKSRFFVDTGLPPNCQELEFAELYGHLQDAANAVDPGEHMRALQLTAWKLSVTTFVQMMMAVEDAGVLTNGFHLWARLHIYEREFREATSDEATWLSKRDSLGMGTYDLASADGITNPDFMLIALSVVSERDFRAFLDLYGLLGSTKAQDQVAALGLTDLAPKYYGAHLDNFCEGLDKPVLPIDGTSAWPYQ